MSTIKLAVDSKCYCDRACSLIRFNSNFNKDRYECNLEWHTYAEYDPRPIPSILCPLHVKQSAIYEIDVRAGEILREL